MIKYLKTILALAILALGLSSASAALITDSFRGSADDTLMYSIPDPENPWAYDQLYYTYLDYEAWYDREIGEGHYQYTAYGYFNLTIELTALGGAWSQTSYYGEAFFPSFSGDFWWSVYGL